MSYSLKKMKKKKKGFFNISKVIVILQNVETMVKYYIAQNQAILGWYKR